MYNWGALRFEWYRHFLISVASKTVTQIKSRSGRAARRLPVGQIMGTMRDV